MNTPCNVDYGFSPYVEISLDNVIHNLNQIKSLLPSAVDVMAVVKDNAYGCGANMTSRVLEEQGVNFFAVARTLEARSLRESGIRSPILVLGPAEADDMRWGAYENIRFTLNDLADIKTWENLDCPVKFHVAIDTGMGRQGILPSEAGSFTLALNSSGNLTLEGAFTHLANADAQDSGATAKQLACFRKTLGVINDNNPGALMVHYASSAAIMRYPPEECTMVRPGIALYGCKPDPAQDFSLDLKPVMSLKACVVKVKRVCAGTPVSYGSVYITAIETEIATIAVGYGQGLPRILGNTGSVLIRNKKYKIAGRVTMDYIMVDIGVDSGIAVNDEAVLMGSQGTLAIYPDDIALLCNTIGYEIMCCVSSCICRRYVLDGKTVCIESPRAF
ncbi:MAG TPA: alanine racemase [Fibrobacteres bacterium]|nr:alanine racemase [Fibrobacterota bacterium]